jgi:hypothetical protein
MKLESEMPEAYINFICEEGGTKHSSSWQLSNSVRHTYDETQSLTFHQRWIHWTGSPATKPSWTPCHQISKGSLSSPIGLHWSPRKLLAPCLWIHCRCSSCLWWWIYELPNSPQIMTWRTPGYLRFPGIPFLWTHSVPWLWCIFSVLKRETRMVGWRCQQCGR